MNNTIQFQYPDSEPFVMSLYRVKGIHRRDTDSNDDASFEVLISQPSSDEDLKALRLPNIFMPIILTAFQNDTFVLISENNRIVDAVVSIEKPVRFSVADYILRK